MLACHCLYRERGRDGEMLACHYLYRERERDGEILACHCLYREREGWGDASMPLSVQGERGMGRC